MADQMPTIYLEEKATQLFNNAKSVSNHGFVSTDDIRVGTIRNLAKALIGEIDKWSADGIPSSVLVKEGE